MGDVKKKDSKKISIILILITVLIISTTGATYAYFALSATNSATIAGESAEVNDVIGVTEILPTAANSGAMVPQLSANTSKSSNALKAAIDGGCVDANTNIACKVYKIQYQNTGTASIRIKAGVSLTSTMSNLKWYTLATGNNVASVPAGTYSYPASFTTKYGNLASVTALGEPLILDAGKYRYWYVAVWIEETGSDQYSADGNKIYIGTVDIQATDAAGNVVGGLTSTFTG